MSIVTNRELYYGLPHIDCYYRNDSVNSNRLVAGATCVCCGRFATNAHHYPPKGTAPVRHRNGFTLRPALFAVCGSGTTGCHDGWHGGARYTAEWKWDSDELAEAWESGELLEEYGEHSNMLYNHGCWVIHDKKLGMEWEVRHGQEPTQGC